ncbi:hypothetical protein PGT21_000993 [Puccinia graminis f. sp. tritici]|uniref:Uncharacterized protein n=1 Tax=Puccinia graminis f. sp. tritici TaxID=56615 RepID=A0A5B0LHA1_PUCGR|nr:hypothetical protein PGT21_000993 [Puccinia graminis f. sp. tritici]
MKTTSASRRNQELELFLAGATKYSLRLFINWMKLQNKFKNHHLAKERWPISYVEGDTQIEPSDAEEPMEAPTGLPADCYHPNFCGKYTYTSPSSPQRSEPIGLEKFLETLKSLTIPGYKNADEQNTAGSSNPNNQTPNPGISGGNVFTVSSIPP